VKERRDLVYLLCTASSLYTERGLPSVAWGEKLWKGRKKERHHSLSSLRRGGRISCPVSSTGRRERKGKKREAVSTQIDTAGGRKGKNGEGGMYPFFDNVLGICDAFSKRKRGDGLMG